MTRTFLDFEQPLREHYRRLDTLKAEHKLDPKISTAEDIEGLEAKIERLGSSLFANLNRWQITMLSRHPERPYALDYIENVFDDFVEIHGDRLFGDDGATIAGFAKLDGHSVAVIGQQKGRNTEENIKYNFGMPNPEGYRKALRVMKIAEKFNKPIITLIDTPGAYPGLGAEERGQGEAIAKNLYEMVRLKVPIISCVTGEGGSGGALALSIANRILMLQYSIYSVISPESCASILWRTSDKKEDAAEALKNTAEDALKLGVIDEIVDEPLCGAHRDYKKMFANLKEALNRNLDDLLDVDGDALVASRISKFTRDWTGTLSS